MNITAITVNYFTEELLSGLLTSLEKQENISELIIVDNGHKHHPSGLTKACSLPVHTLNTGANIGFGAAVNRAIERTRTRWALIVNPDARLNKDCLRSLQHTALKCNSPLVGPRFYWDDQHIFRLPPAIGDSPTIRYALHYAEKSAIESDLLSFSWSLQHKQFWQQSKPFYQPFLSGACLLVDLEWLERKNEAVFDEQFFLYYEDTDLCLRVASHGGRPMCDPGASVVHYANQSPEPETSKHELYGKSSNLFFKKHFNTTLENQPQIPNAILGHQHTIVNLGKAPIPPVFDHAQHSTDGCYFEISLNRHFTPFVQSEIKQEEITMPETIWNRMHSGVYFSRLRHPEHGSLIVWQWEKTNPPSGI